MLNLIRALVTTTYSALVSLPPAFILSDLSLVKAMIWSLYIGLTTGFIVEVFLQLKHKTQITGRFGVLTALAVFELVMLTHGVFHGRGWQTTLFTAVFSLLPFGWYAAVVGWFGAKVLQKLFLKMNHPEVVHLQPSGITGSDL
jgi:hypothetical protein